MPSRGRLIILTFLFALFVGFESSRLQCVTVQRPITMVEIVEKRANVSGVEERMLVIVIAGAARGEVYPSYRGIWTAVAERVASLGVHVYLVSMDNWAKAEITFADHQLIFKGADSDIPGVLNSTVMGLDYVYANNLPGSKAPYVLRTNLSSFWQFNKLLAWLRNKIGMLLAGKLGGDPPYGFPSGSGIVMTFDVCQKLLSLPRAELLSVTEPDDVVIGVALRPFVNVTSMPRKDFIYGQATPEELNGEDFHYRIKSHTNHGDLGIMTMFFAQWYEDGTITAARTYPWLQTL